MADVTVRTVIREVATVRLLKTEGRTGRWEFPGSECPALEAEGIVTVQSIHDRGFMSFLLVYDR